jgi:hypothetical protein
MTASIFFIAFPSLGLTGGRAAGLAALTVSRVRAKPCGPRKALADQAFTRRQQPSWKPSGQMPDQNLSSLPILWSLSRISRYERRN